MSLKEIVSGSREKISEIQNVFEGILEDDESTLIEKKDKLEEKVQELPVSGREWKNFSSKLDMEKHDSAEELAENFGWNSDTEFEVAKIYSNMTYFEAEIALSEAQKSVYDAGNFLRELEEYIEGGSREEGKIAEEYNRAREKLNEAEEEFKEAEKEFDRSRATVDYFGISGTLEEELAEKEEITDKTRGEIKSVMKHLVEIKGKIT